MPLDLAVNISTAGCQLSAVVSSHNKITGDEELSLNQADELLNDASKILEAIKYTANMRMLEVYNFGEYFEPGEWQKVVQVLDVWSGRVDPGQVVARWQSIKEEQAALEANRQQYAEDQMSMVLSGNGQEIDVRPTQSSHTTFTANNRYNCDRCNADDFASHIEHSEGCGL